ncbi:translation elongation factor Ts [Rickettsia rickettsii]|uniref:Elongation factor Ts n=2 Tax=Rickettsia rickettsii TaxID=783 RepID=EFTS_RICRO|nr:translation elongation factor Ts [Rickettsia rickettsii]A8GQP8.1 RecName: Full=Elongation factor Ts; Short=EF-Ts [Rickettsia rickettsii str. 'Sheila Smith']B0BW39.1 RecName: Full=Elongation factor Ts; Short=EF-Ts [Rickettsia rickettsii str. Iowa]ABV75723.1 elongation factor Ts [Rickettsia rickettsii str. 'Sheila Smith']ABY72065.1 protein translation elongation factor Ts (EF-Ts) [Rickettsia rickettsii str. Iowa]AFB22713.1 elongation factor Ts [Rickettsia rickettsii str. Brazil]AFB23051.1 el
MSEINISAVAVKELREKTGAGMMDCKKALIETSGNFEEAIDFLRKKGLAAAAKKAGRIASEGLTAAKVDGLTGVVIEVNSETDFVARNEQFQDLVKEIANLAVIAKTIDTLKTFKMQSGKSVEEEVIENIATIGENLTLRRMDVLEISEGAIGSYVHNEVVPNLGKISVLVGLVSNAKDKAKLEALAKQIAVHVAGNNPQSIDDSSLDQALVERERKVFFEKSKEEGKPDNIIAKMVEGRIRKFFSEVVLLQQNFLFEPKLTVAEVIKNAEKELGAEIKIAKFIRYELGEGIEHEEKNFADEVAAITQG